MSKVVTQCAGESWLGPGESRPSKQQLTRAFRKHITYMCTSIFVKTAQWLLRGISTLWLLWNLYADLASALRRARWTLSYLKPVFWLLIETSLRNFCAFTTGNTYFAERENKANTELIRTSRLGWMKPHMGIYIQLNVNEMTEADGWSGISYFRTL